MSLAFSAIMMVGELVLPEVIRGMTEASMTRRRERPRTRRRSSRTARGSDFGPIAAAPALARFRPDELRPGAAARSEEELAAASGAIGTTIFHPVGTAKMGLPSDPLAVVDERLRVMGVEGLRVIDASVMPTITSGNTNSPTIMIAEKGAAMVLEGR